MGTHAGCRPHNTKVGLPPGAGGSIMDSAMHASPLAPHTSTPAELQERLAAERSGRPFLVYRDGGGHQRILPLDPARDELTVGRRPACDIPLSWELAVSRVHAELVRVGSDWALVDDGLSRNGSYVNEERVQGRRRLRDGDRLRFGQTVVVFCRPSDAESRVTENDSSLDTITSVTEAQRRVLLALCRPYAHANGFASPATNRQIADELFLSVDAVKGHLRALFQVFGVGHLPQNEKRARLVERAFTSGAVTARDL
jgi:pSer/pThr/pTyr-binding forkhead associated (FHA) protein